MYHLHCRRYFRSERRLEDELTALDMALHGLLCLVEALERQSEQTGGYPSGADATTGARRGLVDSWPDLRQ